MRRRGLALPFALFFTGLMFCLCTVMAVEALTNLRLTTLESEKIRQQALARGAVEAAIAQLNRNPNAYAGHSSESTAKAQPDEEGLQISCWVESDPNYPQIRHVRAKVGGKTCFQVASRAVREGPDISGAAYAQVPGFEHGADALDGLFSYENEKWRLLPPVPFVYYDANGVPQSPGGYCRALPFICADTQGHLYAVNHPLWHALMHPDSLVRPLLVKFMSQKMQHDNVWTIFLDMHAMAEANFTLPFAQAAVMRYDQATGNWDALPAVRAFRLLPNGQVEPTGNCVNQGMLSQPSCDGKRIYLGNWRAGGDIIYTLDLTLSNPTQDDWTAIPPPPNTLYKPDGQLDSRPGRAPILGSVTQDGHGTMYAHYGDVRPGEIRSGVFRWDGSNWHLLPPPPREYYTGAGGALVREAGVPANFCFMRSAPGGELHGMWWTEDGRGQFLKFAGGVWSALRPPLDSTPNTLDCDGEGALLVKYARPNQFDAMYRIHRGESRLMDALPQHFYDDTGALQQLPGQAECSQGIAGGGLLRSSSTRFFPVGSY